MFSSATNNQNSTFFRALGVLLILFILYGTTVEAAHRHGGVLSSTTGASSLVDDSQTKSTTTSKSSCNACLLCQLHQNLSNSLIAVAPDSHSLDLQVIFRSFDRVLVHSISEAPQSGRAPPKAN